MKNAVPRDSCVESKGAQCEPLTPSAQLHTLPSFEFVGFGTRTWPGVASVPAPGSVFASACRLGEDTP